MINTEQIANLLGKSVEKTEELCSVMSGIGFTDDQMIGILEAIKMWHEDEVKDDFLNPDPKSATAVLRAVRHILKTPEGIDITQHAKNIMEKLV